MHDLYVPQDEGEKTDTKQITLKMPMELYREIEWIMQRQKSYFYPQEFIRDAIGEKIQKWKDEHPREDRLI